MTRSLQKILLLYMLLTSSCIWCTIIKCSEVHSDPKSCTINNYNRTNAIEFDFYANDITRIAFINSQLSFIPQGVFSKLSKLEIVDFSNCHIEQIAQYNFSSGYNLKQLNLSYNNLTELNSSVFEGAPSLTLIDMSYNRISLIDPDAFRYLINVLEINLSNNQIKILSNPIFIHTKQIQKIDLSGNFIEVIMCGDLFKNLILTELNLNNNNIIEIDETILRNAKSIKILDLNSNRISNISFANLTNIEHIRLNNNMLNLLQIGNSVQVLHANHNKLNISNLLISSDCNLIELSLVHNALSCLSFTKMLPNLIALDVSDNPLERFSGDSSDIFAEVPNLKILKLRSINLNRADFYIFSKLRNLEVLDISYNNLKSIDFNWFSLSENLQQLKINGNRLHNQTLDELEYLFPNLKSMNISDNMWVCSVLAQVLKQLKQLKINVLLDETQSITNETNIRGIRCSEYKNVTQQTIRPINRFERICDNNIHYYKRDVEEHFNKITQSLAKMENNSKIQPVCNYVESSSTYLQFTALSTILIVSISFNVLLLSLIYCESFRSGTNHSNNRPEEIRLFNDPNSL